VLNVLYWFCVDSNFEILDLANDDPHLHTVPQQIGEQDKNCWFVIVASILFLEFFKTNFIEEQLIKLGFSFGSYVFYYFCQ
jgi:hypothetical protein